MEIKAYLKPTCGWSRGVRAMFKKYELQYEDLDIIGDRDLYDEMVQKSGQHLSPCVEIDGVMLADVSGEEVENYLVANNLVQKSSAEAEYPTNQSCSAHRREDPQTVRFF
ncbi:MAG: glutaredoxin [Verrucomicrobiota bacterium]